MDALKASVATVAGGSAWTPLGPGVLAVKGGARLDTTVATTDGRPWHRVFIVGLRNRNVVAIAWSQPVAVYDELLLASVVSSIELTPALYYNDGDLIDPPLRGSKFTMSIPGFSGDVRASHARRAAIGRCYPLRRGASAGEHGGPGRDAWLV